jgi:hypothetical protein
MSRYATAFGSWTIPTADRIHEHVLRSVSQKGFRTLAIGSYGSGLPPLDPGDFAMHFKLLGSSESDLYTQQTAMNAALGLGRQKLRFHFVDTAVGPELFCYAVKKSLKPRIANLFVVDYDLVLHIDDPTLYQVLTTGQQTAAISGLSQAVTVTTETVSSAIFGESWDERTFVKIGPITTTPFTFTLTNSFGNLRTSRVLVRLVPAGANGYTNPKVENLTLSQSIQTTFDGLTTSHLWQSNSAIGPGRIRNSTNGGTTWNLDAPNWTLGDLNGPTPIEFTVGANSMKVTDFGTPNYYLYLLWLPAYDNED